MFFFSKLVAILLAPCLVLLNTRTFCHSPLLIKWVKSAVLLDLSTGQIQCFIASTVEFLGVTEISAGSWTRPFASLRMSSEKVAENINVWRFFGNNLIILLIS